MSEKPPKSEENELPLKSMVNKLTARLEPLGAEALRSGLTAFITAPQAVEFEAVPVEMIRFGIFSFRLPYPDSELANLTEAIKQFGFTGSLVGRRKGSMVEVAFGERRVRAAEKAGVKSIPVQISELDDRQMFEIGLDENLLFNKLSPLDEAFIYQKMVGDLNYSLEETAKLAYRSTNYVAERILLVRYPEIERALRAGTISAYTALQLAKVEDKALRAKMLHQALSTSSDENIPSRFFVTTIGFEPQPQPSSDNLTPVEQSIILNGTGARPSKSALKKVAKEALQQQYSSLEGLVNSFIKELKSQDIAILSQDESWRKKGRKLLKLLEAELGDSLRQLK